MVEADHCGGPLSSLICLLCSPNGVCCICTQRHWDKGPRAGTEGPEGSRQFLAPRINHPKSCAGQTLATRSTRLICRSGLRDRLRANGHSAPAANQEFNAGAFRGWWAGHLHSLEGSKRTGWLREVEDAETLGITSAFVRNGIVDDNATRDGERTDLDQLMTLATGPCLKVER